MLALCALRADGPGLALGTRQGVVKRVNPEVLGKDEWDVIGLKDGDEVVGAVELRTGDEELCFISSDAQLLHFGAAGVRPQGRTGGGMAGIKLGAGQRGRVVRRARPGVRPVVVTASGSSTALPGTEPGAVKVTPFAEYPGKGRATGGRALPPVPQGRGRPDLRLGRAPHRPGRPRPAARRSTCPRRTAGATAAVRRARSRSSRAPARAGQL